MIVYRHRRLDNFNIFYVGIESIKMKPTTLRAMLKGQNKNKTDMTYLQY